MASSLTREQLVRDAVRLRRAHHRQPLDEDLVAVRADIERAAGPTVGRAASARLLGVSQTALDRWIAAGDVPVVLTPQGRREVPLPALIGLLDALDSRRSDAERHPLAALLRERRLRTTERSPLLSVPEEPTGAQSHRTADLRSLAYHHAVADRLDETIVADARVHLRRWREEGRIHRRYAETWEGLLAGSRTHLVQVLRADDDQAATLRQSSPFAGVLDEQERRELLGLNERAPR